MGGAAGAERTPDSERQSGLEPERVEDFSYLFLGENNKRIHRNTEFTYINR